MLTIVALLQFLFQPSLGQPVDRVWIRSRLGATASVQAIAPDVHDVYIDVDYVHITSAGLSFQSFGPLQAAPLDPNGGKRHFEFRIPRSPQPAANPTPTPPGLTGLFINGVPIYNPAGALSYQDQDLWHVDAVALADDGTLTATGRTAVNPHPVATPPLLQQLLERRSQHSPIIGFALDGYPIYGPYAGGGHPQRSSFQLRKIANRRTLPDGLELPPSQEGPPISPDFPLGTFAEDYTCVPGSGDLDCHNGRFAITPEYPNGTYAYFVSTNAAGKLTFPYLIGTTYAGVYSPDLPAVTTAGAQSGLTLATSDQHPRAKQAVTWVFQAAAPALEKTHEKPMHLIVVSRDQSRFEHVHPELVAANQLRLAYTFPSAGDYFLYADFTPAGGVQSIARFEVHVDGETVPNTLDPNTHELTAAPKLTISGPLETGRDLTFRFDLSQFRGLDRYLGAWGHIILMSADGADFLHAHPKENLPTVTTNPWVHTHDAATASPGELETTTGFRRPGFYKIWLQIQRGNRVLTFPYTVQIVAGAEAPVTQAPTGALTINVDSRGFTPARVTVPANQPIRLVFYRADSQNCAGRVVFPALKIEKDLPPQRATVVDLPAQPTGNLAFGCGMGMFRGAIVIGSDKP